MKRDMDLVRKILIELEKEPHGFAPRDLRLDAYKREEVGFHVYLMGQAGLLRVADVSALRSGSPMALPINIEWEGYEFLEAARPDSMWEKAKERIVAAGGGLTIELLKEVLLGLARGAVGL
jgi:hypothetical protein